MRDYLRQCGREDAWTELQGYVYGAAMQDALPYPGVLDFFTRSKSRGLSVCIVSHRTRHPFVGPLYDLHQAAHQWLESHGFYDGASIGLERSQVYFELTKEMKLERIAGLGCTHFIDDLPEFLEEPGFPASVERILFDPGGHDAGGYTFCRAGSWAEVDELLMGRKASTS